MTVPIDFLHHLESNGERFAAALAEVDPDRPVPSCPGWTARDLLAHLAEVQWFWTRIVDRRAAHPDELPGRFEADPDVGTLLGEYRAGLSALVETLRSTGPETPVWTWDEHGRTAGWVRRRQAHEALVHRVDAEQTAGTATPIDAVLAADGVDEVLRVSVGGLPSWGSFTPDGSTMRLAQTDGEGRWGVAFGRFRGTSRSGRRLDLDACTVGVDAEDPDAEVVGPASSLDLWLWGRGPIEDLEISGDRALAGRLRALAGESTR